MDGLSVAASCIAVIQAADQTCKVISQFVRDCKDAKNDLAAVSQELSTLARTLSQLKDLVPDGSEFFDSDLTNDTKKDIQAIIESCLIIAKDIEDVLSAHEGNLAAVSWATRGKRKIATFKTLLETNRRALNLAVDTITLAVTQDVKKDTSQILDNTTHTRGDISALIDRIRRLEAMVANKDPNDPRTFMLMRYLNDLSSVAGSVCDMSSRPVTPESDISDHIVAESSPANVPLEESTKSYETQTARKSPGLVVTVTNPTETEEVQTAIPIPPASKTSSSTRLDQSALAGSAESLTTNRTSPSAPKAASKVAEYALSSDGNKILWRDKRYMIYDIDSGEVNDADPKPPPWNTSIPELRQPYFATTTLKVEILTTDASLLLGRVHTTAGCWLVVYNEHPTSILPLSKDCALYFELNRSTPSLVKVVRTKTADRYGLSFRDKLISRAQPVNSELFTFSREHQTVMAISKERDSAFLYIWKLHPDWFADGHGDMSFQKIRKIQLPPHNRIEETAIIILLPGSNIRVLAIKLPSDGQPQDFIITDQELVTRPGGLRNIFCRSQQKPSHESLYSFSRSHCDGKFEISEDRKLIMIKF
ncbi:hypothetical protein F53441_10173 [Fusarium austroafricanum]|uniref:Azaphilone pigments biosynthesis cluster protein L N-terminal domain-containing protein n=1 Tax=Fusarium austroafricanum TaxID=2364996 RepID=A0A8H4K7L4_9HYPO|nr:hypothetical protein F53441_10173 [Fusarium austroafricanum]